MSDSSIKIPGEAFLPVYDQILKERYPIVFLWGGRDAGRSREVAQIVVSRMLKPEYFRFILIKKTAESIKDSQWKDIKQVVEDWGLSQYFEFKIAPLEIVCKLNGNTCIARGCDNPEKLKSISNPSGAWYEEANQLSENDYITASTTLRNPQGFVEEYFTFNPEVPDGSPYEDFWLFNIFLKKQYDKGILRFIDTIEIPVDGTVFKKKYISIHATYKDNPFCTVERRAKLERLKIDNPYYFKMYVEGFWGNRISGGEALKNFDSAIHVGKFDYDKDLAVHLYFDENVVPYFPCSIWQVKGDYAYKIDEIAATHPNNTVSWICRDIANKLRAWQHKSGVFVGGDATSQKDDVKQEKGHDLFKLIMDALAEFHPVRRTFTRNPSVVMSLNYFNSVLAGQRKVKVQINERCRLTRRDYEMTKEAPDGTIDKKKSIDSKTGQSYQKQGHFLDSDRYFLCTTFNNDYMDYQRGGSPGKIISGKNISRNSYR